MSGSGRRSSRIPLRIVGAVLVVGSLAGLGASIPVMMKRLSRRETPAIIYSQPIASPQFEFRGHTLALSVVETAPESAGASPDKQSKTLQAAWRGQTYEMPIAPGLHDDPRLPGLLRFEDWFRVLLVAEGAVAREDLERMIEQGSVTPRLVLVMRLPAEGFDPGSWGLVRRREWRYRFVELKSEGPPEQSIEVSEASYRELELLGDPAYARKSGQQDQVWKHHGMLHVTSPTLVRSRNKPMEDAMSAMGWTWPLAWGSVFGLTAGLALLAAASVGRMRDSTAEDAGEALEP